jgi:hypothetical protein
MQNLDFWRKLLNVQFYGIKHIFQSDNWLKMKFYEDFLDLLFYLG